MKLSLKSEYSLLALAYMARNHGERLVKIEEISRENNIPKKYLEQILLSLKSGRLVRSRRGKDGGYELTRDPKTITLAEIIRWTDGALAPVISVSKYFYDSTPLEQNEKILNLMKDIRDFISEKLENTSLEDIL